MKNNIFIPSIICRATGLSRPVTLRNYHKEFGLETQGPVTRKGKTKGLAYTFEDALAVAVMSRLIRRGIGRRYAAEIVNDTRQYFSGPYWLTVMEGQTAKEFYAYGRRETGDKDFYRKPGIRWAGRNSLTDLANAFRPDPALDNTAPEDVIVLAIHEISADLRSKLDRLSASSRL
jgi:hypothetical protein